MDNTEIKLFVGDPVTDPTEQRLIKRLRLDLERHGARGVLYANFFPRAKQPRQIDLLIRIENHTAHVEIKGYRADYPIRGRQNGPWIQIRPDGEERELGTNCGMQARNGTFAISDAMRSLARDKRVNSPDDAFFRHIDTIVGMWETVPEGSDIELPPHVHVMEYDELLTRLLAPGPVVPWSNEDWDVFARFNSLYQPNDVSESEQFRSGSLAMIDDYRLYARQNLSDRLGPFVELGAEDSGGGGYLTAYDVGRLVAVGGSVAIVGPSGCGKSYLAKHLAVSHCDAGRLVVWTEASDYKKGEFQNWLARSMGPFSAERWRSLIGAAEEAGAAITVVVDGLNECPDAERAELLLRLRAFVLQHPAGVLVTSTEEEELMGTLGAKVVRPCEPDEEARNAILDSRGARNPGRISSQFRTPHDLAIAAECENELHENASVAELHDAFIRWHVPTETLRSGLRVLACRLHAKLRTSMSQLEAATTLASEGLMSDAQLVDDVLGSSLLKIDRHRVRFRHDLLAQHLAAEDLVRSSDSGRSLAARLSAPANRPLAKPAMGIAGDSDRIWEALCDLCDPALFSSAIAGEMGTETRLKALDGIRDVLQAGIAATAAANITFEGIHTGTLEGVENGMGRWVTNRRWTELERVLLDAAGIAIFRGLFVDDVCELLDRTDRLCSSRARSLKADGIVNPVSAVVAATYGLNYQNDDRSLAATLVARAFRNATMMAGPYSGRNSDGLASRFAEGAGDGSWGRYFFAVVSINPTDSADRGLFAWLLRRAWDASGYHLRLEALSKAQDLAAFCSADDPHHAEVIEVLESLKPSNLFLQSSLVEALARFGEIKNLTTPEELQDEILAVITNSDNAESCRDAGRIVSFQFEEPDIVGPYYEAVQGLVPQQKTQLFAMAVAGTDPAISVHLAWTLDQLATLVPTGDAEIDDAAKEVFAEFFDAKKGVMPQDVSGACLAAIRGWAKLESALPPEPRDLSTAQRNWRLVASLLFRNERGDAKVDTETTWSALLAEPSQTAATLAQIKHADIRSMWDEEAQDFIQRRYLERLAEDYPERMRHLFERALKSQVEDPFRPEKQANDAANLAIRTLGIIGDEATAALLRVYILDPETGHAAVEAIRQINDRVSP